MNKLSNNKEKSVRVEKIFVWIFLLIAVISISSILFILNQWQSATQQLISSSNVTVNEMFLVEMKMNRMIFIWLGVNLLVIFCVYWAFKKVAKL